MLKIYNAKVKLLELKDICPEKPEDDDDGKN